MRKYILALLAIIFFIPTVSYADGTLKCGIKPIPKAGCRIGRCVDGMWEQICDTSPTISCGIKPIPDVGCRIGHIRIVIQRLLHKRTRHQVEEKKLYAELSKMRLYCQSYTALRAMTM